MKDLSTALTSNGVSRRGPAVQSPPQPVTPRPVSSTTQQQLLHQRTSRGAHPHWSLPALLSALAGVAVYLNTLQNEFCFDDSSAILTNPDLLPKTPLFNLFLNDFWGTPMHQEGSHKSYRPLCVLTFRLNYMLHGLDPMGYHLVNVLLHGVVCYIFVAVTSLVVFKDPERKMFPLFVAGLSFAVHPVHTEAVAGVVGRAECLSAIFFLLTFLAYKRSLSTKGTGARWFVLSLLLCIYSLLSKEQGITVLSVCICYDYFIYNNNNLNSSLSILRGFVKSVTPIWFNSFVYRFISLVGFFVALMMLRVKIMKAELPVFTIHDNPAVNEPTPYRQLHWLYLIFQNVWLLLSPSFLCADWTMGTVPLINSLIDPRNLLTILTFTGLAHLAWYSVTGDDDDCPGPWAGSKSYRQGVLFALSILVFPFLPASNLLFPVGFVVAERVLYIPSMGYSILIAIGSYRLTSASSKFTRLATKIGLGYLLIFHTMKTLDRNRDWRSNIDLFTSGIKINTNNAKLYSNLGHEYEQLMNYSYAESLYRTAIEIQSDDIGAFINLGRILKVQGKLIGAEKAYRKAIEMMPKGKKVRVALTHINVYFNLANLIKDDPSHYEEAYRLYRKAISMKPSFLEAYLNMGDLLLKQNKTVEAKNTFLKAVELSPEYADAHFNLGTTYIQLGDDRLAESSYRRALAIDPEHSLSLFNLGMILSDRKDEVSLSEAMEWFTRLIKLTPKDAKVYFQLGMIQTDLRHISSAKTWFSKAIELVPNYRQALYNLGFLNYQENRYEEAVKYLMALRQHHPNHVRGMRVLGDSFIYLRRFKEAKEVYLLCLKYDPKHIVATHNLGVAMTELGDFKEAERLFQRTLELDPNHKAAKKHLEGARAKLEQLERQ
ncbi:PREDICTED: transmembrane and TPR repeat-containing protein 3-like [Amphimedon queenslandica]|uniref:dolichyl-phosphate-mannose--protein mannosyltransferase n=1 Tax=Amphimedon queenslandica TaxID=400682 RepID=A0A1X7UFA4_AMPQE|nr:PREDICTED: transmembrane and TPR repeat-containing protein 3-like [Amphimedon queenslandica]|eukprot:XP_003388214.1 PREDICTED: transmembrane and TPR repeat-containing protein 3-like [Amphimedon queenslandica]